MDAYLFYFTLFCSNCYIFGHCGLFPLDSAFLWHTTWMYFKIFLTIPYYLAMKGALGSICISPSLVLKQPFIQGYSVSFNQIIVSNKYTGNRCQIPFLFLPSFLFFFIHSVINYFIFTFAYLSQMDVNVNISNFKNILLIFYDNYM